MPSFLIHTKVMVIQKREASSGSAPVTGHVRLMATGDNSAVFGDIIPNVVISLDVKEQHIDSLSIGQLIDVTLQTV